MIQKVSRKIGSKLLSVALSISAIASCFSACGKDLSQYIGDIGVNEEVDTGKTQLYISNYNGGYGDDWLGATKKRFEEFYKDTSFESGKKGVQVLIENEKVYGQTLELTLDSSRNAIFYSEGMDYYSFVQKGLVADITDVVTSSLEEYGDTGTIEDKLSASKKNYLKTSDGKYFGLPHYDSYMGIVYDIDLFEECNFYFAANPDLNAETTKVNSCISTGYDNENGGFILDASDKKSNGPDGKPNTFDDGLPATYDEYFKLCDFIVENGMTPVIWTGKYQSDYSPKTLNALLVDSEGADQMKVYFSRDGVAKNLIDVDEDGNITRLPEETITPATGYRMFKTKGYYDALSFYERLLSKSAYYSSKCFNGEESHLDAQNDFLFSRPASAKEGKPIAMLYEGIYWENESKATARDVANIYGQEYSKENRRFGLMPMPKADKEDVGKDWTVANGNLSLMIVNGNLKGVQLDLAKKFVKFAHTSESLREFTTMTNTPVGYEYDLNADDLAKMTTFGKQVWTLKKSSIVIDFFDEGTFYINNKQRITWTSLIGSSQYSNAAKQLRAATEGHVSAATYFNGISAYYTKARWESLFKID